MVLLTKTAAPATARNVRRSGSGGFGEVIAIPSQVVGKPPQLSFLRMVSLNRRTRLVSKSGNTGPVVQAGIRIADFRASARRSLSHLLGRRTTQQPADG